MKKILFSLFISTLFIFTSCSNDDDNYEQKTVTYSEQKTIMLKMYIGGSEGGKEANITSIDPGKYWGSLVKEPEAGESIIFNKETLIAKEGDKTAEMAYIFNNEELWVASYYQWTYYGYGNKDKIIVPLNYIYSTSKEKEPIITSNIKKNFILEDAISASHFDLLSDMKSEKDTLMWYSVERVYQALQ